MNGSELTVALSMAWFAGLFIGMVFGRLTK